MADRLAIIGFPFSGKTTVLQAACGIGREHLHAGGESGEHIGTLKHEHDPRLLRLAEIYESRKLTPLTLELWDFPGFDLTTEPGRQHARRLLAEVRQCDLLVIVLRAFENPSVPQYRDRIDPAADLDELMEEFVFADMDQLSRRIEKLEQQQKKPSPTREQEKKEIALLKRCLEALEAGQGLHEVVHGVEEDKMLRSFALLTQRPCVVIINVDENRLGQEFALKPHPMVRSSLVCAVEYERQLQELSDEDREVFLAEAGITELLADRLAEAAMSAMGRIRFYTAGDNEARAWPLGAGISAVEAAGKIHSDIARGFIRAETIAYADIDALGAVKEARSAGKLRLEGKDYVIKDGDVIFFRFNI